MKQILAICILFLGLSEAYSQNGDVHTLIGNRTRVGAYVSFENQVKNFNSGSLGMYTGGRFGFIFNRYLFIGVGGYGLSSDLNLKDLVEDGDIYSIETGYGGLSIEPIAFPRQAIHLSFPLFVGAGGAEIREGLRRRNFVDDDIFWMYQGGANIEMNVTKWFRISGGVYYTETEEFSLENTRGDLLEGLTYGMSLKLGRF